MAANKLISIAAEPPQFPECKSSKLVRAVPGFGFLYVNSEGGDFTLTLTAIGKLRSVRSDKMFNHDSNRAKTIAIRRESARWIGILRFLGLHQPFADLCEICRLSGRKIKVEAISYRKGALDADNLELSFNKLIIDGLVREGFLKSDAKGILDMPRPKEVLVSRDKDQEEFFRMTFSVSGEPAIDKAWEKSPRQRGITKRRSQAIGESSNASSANHRNRRPGRPRWCR